MLAAVYEWEVRTKCFNDSSLWSITETFTIGSACVPLIPQNLTEQNITNNSANLTWDPVAGAVNYKVKWRKVGSPVTAVLTSVNNLTLTNLTQSSTYKWRVRSECDPNSSSVSSYSPWKFFSTLSSIRTTGGDSDLALKLNIFPNPNRGLFTINFLCQETSDFEMLIRNSLGQVIVKDTQQEFKGEYIKEINLSDLPIGIYIVEIKTKYSFVFKRVVLQ